MLQLQSYFWNALLTCAAASDLNALNGEFPVPSKLPLVGSVDVFDLPPLQPRLR